MPKDTSTTKQATLMAAALALGKALGAIRSIPGPFRAGSLRTSRRSVAEYDGPERISQVLATLRDCRNLEGFCESRFLADFHVHFVTVSVSTALD
jgi:hypothetical protein